MDAFSLNDAKIKVTERSRGRMKIQIKLSKDEAEGFKNFCKLKPPELNDETFYKQIFFAGCNTMTEQIRDLVAKHEESKQGEPMDEEQSQETSAEEQSPQETPKIEQPNG
jgi:hypothetical protein|tara:strand:- start:3406 stop:3735 length:330 start_codon:yes stop_codon:yes gene_type:complete